MKALVHHLSKEEDISEEYLQRLISELPKAIQPHGGNMDLMYGAGGFMSCCLFLRQQIPSFPLGVIPIIFDHLLRRGEEDWRRMQAQEHLIDREPHKR
jgi:hypothetical protein